MDKIEKLKELKALFESGCVDQEEFNFLKAEIIYETKSIDSDITVLKIGIQTWCTKNLDLSMYRNGDEILQVQNADAWDKAGAECKGAWCYHGNKTENGVTYGKLYNWFAVKDSRGLAPKGYHIRSDAEWTMLSDYLGGCKEAGTKMKSRSGWKDNGNGTNASGFTGLNGGSRSPIGRFNNVGLSGYWWSSTEDYNANYAWIRSMYYENGMLHRFASEKKYGFSIRCLAD